MELPRGTIRSERVASSVLRGNLPGDPATRDLYVYLPPGYERGEERYPVAWCLSGFTGRGRMLLNDNPWMPGIGDRMDALLAGGLARPMILALPDCFTYLGGSQYVNSPALGDYEDHVIQALNIVAMSAAYSPNVNAPPAYCDLPFDLETGEVHSDVWKRWLEWDPLYAVERHAESLKGLRLLFLDCGRQDEFFLELGARCFVRRLEALGVRHEYQEFEDGHMNI